MQPVIAEGVTWSVAYAANRLAHAAAAAGVEQLAIQVPASFVAGVGYVLLVIIDFFWLSASTNSFAIMLIVAVVVFFVVSWLSSILLRKYYLTVNVYNFDPDHSWSNITWHGDNTETSNGEWKSVELPKYEPAGMPLCDIAADYELSQVGSQLLIPGFQVKNLESVVTYLSICFTNVSTFLEGLGVGLVIGSSDNAHGMYFALLPSSNYCHLPYAYRCGIEVCCSLC